MLVTSVPPLLLKFQDEIRLLSVDEHAVPYIADRWTATFGDDPDLKGIIAEYPNQLTRADLCALASKAISDASHVRRAFMATMIWGYGTIGYGPWRMARMLESADAADAMLRTTAGLVVSGKLADAYSAFALPWCNRAFFTKFFYVIGLGANSSPLPLILDARVLRSLSALGQEVSETAEGYVRWVSLMNAWAEALDCRPDAVEMFLFEKAGQLGAL